MFAEQRYHHRPAFDFVPNVRREGPSIDRPDYHRTLSDLYLVEGLK
jgi:hypothetical protein